MSLPVDRSITVSAPKCTAVCSFSSSIASSPVTAELPMFALILQRTATPIPSGSSRPARWTLLAGMTRRPAATSCRTNSASRYSARATYSISGVTSPARAASIWVFDIMLLRSIGRPPWLHAADGDAASDTAATPIRKSSYWSSPLCQLTPAERTGARRASRPLAGSVARAVGAARARATVPTARALRLASYARYGRSHFSTSAIDMPLRAA